MDERRLPFPGAAALLLILEGLLAFLRRVLPAIALVGIFLECALNTLIAARFLVRTNPGFSGPRLADFALPERLVWVQEEPANMGGWEFVRELLREIWRREFSYAGRRAAASPAVGSQRVHHEELAAFLAAAFDEPDPT